MSLIYWSLPKPIIFKNRYKICFHQKAVIWFSNGFLSGKSWSYCLWCKHITPYTVYDVSTVNNIPVRETGWLYFAHLLTPPLSGLTPSGGPFYQSRLDTFLSGLHWVYTWKKNWRRWWCDGFSHHTSLNHPASNRTLKIGFTFSLSSAPFVYFNTRTNPIRFVYLLIAFYRPREIEKEIVP